MMSRKRGRVGSKRGALMFWTKIVSVATGAAFAALTAASALAAEPTACGEVLTACGRCDSCLLRLKGFSEAGAEDPVTYQTV